MGVPVFFKWLTMRNPKLIRDAVQPNQNQYDSGNPSIDNFYVDMNGLIHPSVNPKDQNIKEPTNFQQQCENIQAYIDKLMNIVRPRKLIYLAVDGVAPRAKMNQQRSRRFRAAMQGEQIIETKTVMLQQYRKMGVSTEQIQLYARKKNFDSNVITPGTIFLNEVCNRVKKYIKKKLQTHRLWKNLIVIFSDANCPGQGQHKIMNFIRQQRASLNYNPNICHCIYGADADLIMLSLATHEPKFYIIREIVITFNDKWCTICGKKGHFFLNCKTATSIDDQLRITQQINAQGIEVNFQFIYIKTIREYLELNFRKCQILFGYDLERIIDDFIFLCFFVGNDFLPHIPCLNIRDGGIDVLLRVYDQSLKQMKDYLTNAGKLNLSSLKIFIDEMKYYQKDLIEEIINKQAFQKQKNALNKMNDNNNNEIDPHLDLLTSFKNELKKRTNQDYNIDDYSVFGHPIQSYKEKYYREKFKIQPKDFLQLKHNISKSYIEALKWICLYYYEGVPSWSWYYPFHYSPFFTDIEVIGQIIQFERGRPFSPFEQLMAVISPKTYYALPKCLQQYMLSPESPIADYFPCSFVIDLVGKKFTWLGQVLLPFIDEDRLLKCLGQYKQNLSLQDRILNQNGSIVMFFNKYGQFGRNLSIELSIGSTINFACQQHYINGIVSITQKTEDIIGANLIQPNSNVHDIHLKNGIEYNPFEELDDQFITHTDKKAYGGQRFLRVIERVLNTRIDKKKPFVKEKSERRRTNMECQNQRNGSRQRSRDQQREYKEDGSKYRRQRDGERQSNNRNEKSHFIESNHRRSK